MKKFVLLGFGVLVLLLALKSKESAPANPVQPAVFAADELPGSSPHLSYDHRGNAVLSWVRKMSDSSAIFCYTVIEKGRKGKTIVVTPSKNIYPHGENIPKIIFKPSGEILAIWGIRNPRPENKHSGLIYYAQSFDGGKSWSAATPLVRDKGGVDQRYSDVTLLHNGEVAIIWLDNRKGNEGEGSAMYYAVTEDREGFTGEKRIAEPVCPCCRTKLFADSRGNIHAVYRGIINDSIRDMVHIVSWDGGKSFSPPERLYNDNWVLRGCPHTGPSMAENEEGLHFAWYTKSGSSYIRSSAIGNQLMSHDKISEVGTHPQIASLPDNGLVIVWDESVKIGKEYYRRIGLQKRNKEGLYPTTEYITSDTAYDNYPVILPGKDRQTVIAFTRKLNSETFVKYMLINL